MPERRAFHVALPRGASIGAIAIDIASASRVPRVSLKPGSLETLDATGRGAIGAGYPTPMARRPRRRRDRLTAWLTGSGAGHLLVVALIFLFTTPKGPPASPEPPSIEMVFGHAGATGLQGPSVPQAEQGSTPPPVAVPPTPLAPPEAEAPPAPAEATPPPSPETPKQPQTKEAAIRPRVAPSHARPTHAARPAHRAARSSNPFANLTDLSLAPSPDIERHGRGGSGNSINLSLGPIVQGGRLSMPFSIRGGHGITSDYQEMLDDWVNRHKYYPEAAAQRGHDGEVTLHVAWDRDGRVLSVELLSSSGDEDLDDAWQGLFRGAHLPPPPPDVPGDPVQMDMTMHYILLH